MRGWGLGEGSVGVAIMRFRRVRMLVLSSFLGHRCVKGTMRGLMSESSDDGCGSV